LIEVDGRIFKKYLLGHIGFGCPPF